MRGTSRVIFDTNVISSLSGEFPATTMRKILAPSERIFVPYFILQELLAGNPSGEMDFLTANDAEIEDSLDTTQLEAISLIESLQIRVCQMLVFGETAV